MSSEDEAKNLDLIKSKNYNAVARELARAAALGRHSDLEFFLKHGVDVNFADGLALQEAIRAGNDFNINFLLDHGADPRFQDNLALKLAVKEGDISTVRKLIQLRVEFFDLEAALKFAIVKGYIDVVKFLLEEDYYNKNSYQIARKLVDFAKSHNQIEIAQMLSEYASREVEEKHFINKILSERKSVESQLPFLSELVKKGANINLVRDLYSYLGGYGIREGDDDHALLIFAMHGQFDLVRYLLNKGKVIHIKEAMEEAEENGYPQIANLLHAFARNRGNRRLNLGELEVLYNDLVEGVEQNRIQQVEAALFNGANPNAIFLHKSIPLVEAASLGHEDIVKLLLLYGANIHIENDFALRNTEDINMIEFLLKNGANVHVNDEELLINAINNENIQLIELLLRYGANPNNIPVLFATFKERRDIMNLLMKHGASRNINIESLRTNLPYVTITFGGGKTKEIEVKGNAPGLIRMHQEFLNKARSGENKPDEKMNRVDEMKD